MSNILLWHWTKKVHNNVSDTDLEQIKNFDAELVVKIAVAGVGHVIYEYESISLSL